MKKKIFHEKKQIKPQVCVYLKGKMIILFLKRGIIMNQEKIGKFISNQRKEKN